VANAARELDVLGDRCQETQRHKGRVEGILLAVQGNPAVPRRRSKDVIRYPRYGRTLDLQLPRPITDLRRIAPNIERGEEGVELHVGRFERREPGTVTAPAR
jgi:hypothetical protein